MIAAAGCIRERASRPDRNETPRSVTLEQRRREHQLAQGPRSRCSSNRFSCGLQRRTGSHPAGLPAFGRSQRANSPGSPSAAGVAGTCDFTTGIQPVAKSQVEAPRVERDPRWEIKNLLLPAGLEATAPHQPDDDHDGPRAVRRSEASKKLPSSALARSNFSARPRQNRYAFSRRSS